MQKAEALPIICSMQHRKEVTDLLTVKGVVLAQRTVGEHSQYIDILTDEHGVLEVLVRGSGKLTSKSGSAAQLFAYSAFCLHQGRRGYTLDSASPIRIFYDLRSSVTAVALASYFVQVIRYAVLPLSSSHEIQRLLLNCLHFLGQKKYPEEMLKCIFELRIASLLGFMPDVVMCRECGEYLPAELFFSIETGTFCCKECHTPKEEVTPSILMSGGVLQAIRHIVLSEMERLFSFRLQEESAEILSAFSEQFLLYHIDHTFSALQYYKAVRNPL